MRRGRSNNAPPASTQRTRRSMVSNRSRDTGPELRVRRALHRAGFRYRIHYQAVAGLRCAVDIAFTKQKIAVFIDGCFWHSCPDHVSRAPRIGTSHADWWIAKLYRNVERDHRVDEALSQAGWTVVRFWEHEAPEYIVEQLQLLLGRRVSEHRLGIAPTEHITAMPGVVRQFDEF